MTGRVISDTGFRGIAYDKPKIRVVSARKHLLKVAVWVQTAADTGDNALFIDLLPIAEAPQK